MLYNVSANNAQVDLIMPTGCSVDSCSCTISGSKKAKHQRLSKEYKVKLLCV